VKSPATCGLSSTRNCQASADAASTEDRLAGVEARAMRKIFGSYRVAMETVIIVAALVLIRWALWSLGVEGISTSPLTSSIVAGGVFVMGLVVAGTLSDYRDAERAPTDHGGRALRDPA
jgi:hypothetical protein